jgi:hypothetical protein
VESALRSVQAWRFHNKLSKAASPRDGGGEFGLLLYVLLNATTMQGVVVKHNSETGRRPGPGIDQIRTEHCGMTTGLNGRAGIANGGGVRRLQGPLIKRAGPLRKKLNARGPGRLNNTALIDGEHEIGIIWSAKCACTKVLLWYFQLIGLLDAALFYNHWPHRYRIDVLYNSQRYRKWQETSNWQQFTWYQFCRDPVKRLLSSYRHNLGHGYADDRISQALGRRVSYVDGYSLDEFLRYLEAQDMASAEVHVRLQYNPVSERTAVKVINIDEADMLREMNAIEREHGLPLTDFASLGAFAKDDRRNAKISVRQRYSPDDVLTRSDAKGAWPVEASILDAVTVERIKRLYARDVAFIYGNRGGAVAARESMAGMARVAPGSPRSLLTGSE